MMAAYLFHFNPLYKKFLGNIFNQTIESVRNASRKSGPRKVSKCRPGRYGVKVPDGKVVNAGTILVRQRSLLICPGLNVGIGFIADLYAKVPGKVIYSFERTNLDPDNWLVQGQYSSVLPKFKQYANIIPEPQHQRFKLVETF